MEQSVSQNLMQIKEQFDVQRSELVYKNILIKKIIKYLISQEINIFELDNMVKNQNNFRSPMDIKLSEVTNKTADQLYGKVEPDFSILKDISKVGTEQMDILQETQSELKYIHRELELAKLIAGQTLESYDEMKINREYYQLMHAKAVNELNIEKNKYKEAILNTNNEIQKAKDQFEKEKLNLTKEFTFEISVKDELLKRKSEYCQTLKKELIYTKNIIKNPRMFESSHRAMNFTQYEIYDFNKSRDTSDPKTKTSFKPQKTKQSNKFSECRNNHHCFALKFETARRNPKILRKISPMLRDRSRHIRLNKSKILSTDRSTDPIHFNLSQESIKKILQKKGASREREMIFQRRNHSVIEYMPKVFNISEVNHTTDNSNKITPIQDRTKK
ncbi:unnamed protein product [Moneuplotes crassus]|uniref:Uncharacterized protein n=1 Tax=Euplotes crassus TaxID=5936 RepID=A0AAD1X8L1_EUPCR|nr:unnamed protein product [Moneuplotes crassus]